MELQRQPSEHSGDTQQRAGNGTLSTFDSVYLKNVWYVAGWASEFTPSTPIARTIIGNPVVIYRKKDGTVVALEDRCAHRWAPLSLGRIEGDDLRCMYHGVKFGPDGRCKEVPGQKHIAKALCVRAYTAVEKHRFVWIWAGDTENMDTQLIPDLSFLDQPSRRLYRGSLNYNAHYSLINDNLLDLSHFSFLHEKTLGRPIRSSTAGPTEFRVPTGSDARRIDRGVRVEGWLPGWSGSVTQPNKIRDGDFWSRIDYVVPGIYVSHGQMYSAGTAGACDGLPPGPTTIPLTDGVSIQAVTPETARRTRYYFSFGPQATDMDEEESNQTWEVVMKAFSEDLQMIEAQQRVIDEYPGTRMVGIAVDRGLTMFRSLMRQLMSEERAVGSQTSPLSA